MGAVVVFLVCVIFTKKIFFQWNIQITPNSIGVKYSLLVFGGYFSCIVFAYLVHKKTHTHTDKPIKPISPS